MRRRLLPWAAGALLLYLLALRTLRQPPAPAQAPGARFWKAPCPLRPLWSQDLLERQQRVRRSPSRDRAPGCGPDRRVESRVADFQQLPQAVKDFLLYRRCRRFPRLLEPRGVCGRGLRLLIAVKSTASSFGRRQAIRQSWGGVGRAAGVGLVFLLGVEEAADGRPDLAGLLACESRRFGDLLQWAFRDTFLNLTLKEVLFLPWLGRHCPGARFVFKGDDDVFVNTERLLDYLDGPEADPALGRSPDLFLGDTILGAQPCRNPGLKYYVPGAFYSGPYPPYAGGAGVLYTGRLARRLERAARALPLFPIDDVFTGMCLQRLGLAPTAHAGFHSFGINESQRWEPCAYRRLFMVHARSPQELILLWRVLHGGNLTCG
ncbi:N-acetyllactosaminide beta-1,3-N-acetylglucosaminyltransferase 2 [Hypanus sabinus]|uniref:N-acetyllactosaminide beta-1,3-N-acetylglucosaminyltransferase 2 n=1 Tax=Hypanus sabinus TaxID=79690 RepID=UPI0028C48EC9|nr:N-acetyllactosaminide beta-1,3-N-acetylglucosaminyltransferase 2 [Hypanus sabinus]XP_059811195.1 N-acetyllactosaminide beta-1,3-N-acetylglucosaminyltransferase 2 [Hypanus sabinus]XP_059811196.1 N-acetyllactosaminide beta-1,3-N-acetylglucosaminyltransferase 2 [Hypanus sabinus]